MDYLGWNVPLLLAQLLNVAILLAWLTLAVVALRRLRELDINPALRLGWAALAVLVPILGALAVLIVNPRHRQAG